MEMALLGERSTMDSAAPTCFPRRVRRTGVTLTCPSAPALILYAVSVPAWVVESPSSSAVRSVPRLLSVALCGVVLGAVVAEAAPL